MSHIYLPQNDDALFLKYGFQAKAYGPEEESPVPDPPRVK
jgi:hypothetical protein